MAKKLCFFAVIASLMVCGSAAFGEGDSLWRLAGKTGSIKVFINDPVNESTQASMSDNLKKALGSALSNRISTKFEIVTSPEASDAQVATIIKSFAYMERGPLKPTPGIATTLLDIAATVAANYAEILVEFKVTDPKTGAVLWEDTLNPYLKRRMEADESVPLIAERVASHFIWKCFGKPSK